MRWDMSIPESKLGVSRQEAVSERKDGGGAIAIAGDC